MIKVTVTKPTAKVVSWSANDVRPAGSMRTQEIWFHTVEEDGSPSFAPVRTEIILDRAKVNKETGEILTPEQAPYAAGEYVLHPSSVYVDRLGKPAFSVRLTPYVKRTA